jgi:hypothetical protein
MRTAERSLASILQVLNTQQQRQPHAVLGAPFEILHESSYQKKRKFILITWNSYEK